MSRWPTKPLSGVALDLQPGFASRPDGDADGVWHLRPLNMTEDGTIVDKGTKRVPCTPGQLNRYSLRGGDVLFNNTNSPELVGKVAVFRLDGVFVFSNHLTRIRIDQHQVIPDFLQRYLFLLWRDGYFKLQCTQWINQAAINVNALSRLPIPLPPLPEQERIVHLLDEAEALRRLRSQADERTGQAAASLFEAMFSDARVREGNWPLKSLQELCSGVFSGATPSTENPDFWNGRIPWISPKDMKSSELFDATDHISELALKAYRLRLLPIDTVLIVVRGMILAHSFPVAITRVPATINQDMKALLAEDGVLPGYLQWLLVSNTSKILGLVSTAGHGTKRLEMEGLLNLRFPVPPKQLQEEFVARVGEIRALEAVQSTSRQRLDDLFKSLLQRAFRGEL